MRTLYEAFTHPVEVKLSQYDGHHSYSFRIYPSLLFLLVMLIGVAATVIVVSIIASDRQALAAQQKVIMQLQQKQEQMHKTGAENEALLSLRDAQISAMQQEMGQLQQQTRNMQQRLNMFDEVLAARKIKGVHMLRPLAFWQEDGGISYNLILVKGENYPRWAKGKLSFSVINAEGIEQPLMMSSGKLSHRFDMTTQSFVNGTLKWEHEWKPKALIITLDERNTRQHSRTSIEIISEQRSLAATE